MTHVWFLLEGDERTVATFEDAAVPRVGESVAFSLYASPDHTDEYREFAEWVDGKRFVVTLVEWEARARRIDPYIRATVWIRESV